MVYKFTCRATASVHMSTGTAELLLKAIGRESAPKGVITVAQMPDAIQTLKDLLPGGTSASDQSGSVDSTQAIALAEHANPLIEMLEQALAANKDITWGV